MPELRLADHFPRRPKECRDLADAFFDCFSTKGVQPEGGDKEAGRRGLAECKKPMMAYDNCMNKLAASKRTAFFRVQEEYRRDTVLKQQAQK